jgi:hypothetical protein
MSFISHEHQENGDILVNHVMLRQIGWVINGGPQDGRFIQMGEDVDRSIPHGGFSPIYVEVGTD